ncbi:MAG: AAA family ATPase, partial [Candidatus Dadabacteria bacterium]|nr:AAA family ATPase [Candidatus Dadabacteria bacterium]
RAGAGSGKTRAIIARYLGILEAGEADIPQIVAVTFTENAASELKSRISTEISKYIDAHGYRGNISEGWRRRFFSAPIGTIHSFCSGILRENVFDSGLPLDFSVIEGSEKDAFYEQNIGKFLLMGIEDGDPRLQRLLKMESYDYAQILKIIAMILKEAVRLHLVPPFRYCGEDVSLEKPDPQRLESMNERLHKVIEEYISVLSSRSEKKKQVLHDLSGKIDMTLGIDRNIRYLKAVYEQAKSEMTKSEVERSRLMLLDTVFSVMGYYDSEINSIYLDLSGDAYRFLKQVKVSEEKIEYEDMIRLTIELLKENPEILGYYRNFLKFIIVDEFQDTDSLQLELMELLTGGDSGGSLIVVGDVNQSVYGFRGAEPEMFGRILGDKNFGKISFAANYRSRDRLIEFFNLFFAGTFPEGYYEEMTVPVPQPDPRIPVEIIACEGTKADESVEREARAVASKIKEIQESSGKIALLFRRSSNASVYEKALAREGIRFQSRMGRDFYDLPEVRDVMSMLRYFLNPQDKLAQASVLRSPYFGASDDELFSHFCGEGEQNSSRVREYLCFLDEKRREYIDGDAFRTVYFAVNGLGCSAAVQALPGGRAKYLNLKKVLLVTENLVSHKGYGLSQVVEHFDSMRRTYEEEQVFEETRDDRVVKLMTVHGAKGLEFHTVFLCNTNYRRVTSSERVMADIEKGFVVRYPASSSDDWEELKSRVERREAWEERRALYVAMTRAEERLFICFSGRRMAREERIQVEAGSFAELIDSKLSLSSRCLEMPQGFTDDAWGISFSGLYDGEVSKESDTISDTSSSERETPLDLKYMEPVYSKEDKPQRTEISPLPDLFSPTDRLKDPERVGSIMHRFLETWDFREEAVEKEIEFVLGEFLVSTPNMKDLLRELSSNLLESELFPFIRAAQKVRREHKFVFDPGESVSKRGRIDLLTEEEGGMRLFDYKYRESIDDDARETYKEQMDGYCEAIRSKFEKPLLSRHIVLIPQVELVSI